ncbi:iron uptake transporter deferrochelatase/peroxidase subunit [Bacillus massiliigorillae]|uniref:iron uptake transporter deferrochelatase/peroxidase subunit n=1 Tax=Bacillus massiliigorillae TaxID=1243664 RepID=UPI0005A71595|nr:iron uptake transporter deferrochelatase/peroxidase subunit [Bacillus massiliigorillae]
MADSSRKITRRELLKLSAVAGAGVAIGASGLGAVTALSEGGFSKSTVSKVNDEELIVPFYGEHQAGIITPQQTNMYIASFNLMTNDRKDVINLLKDWTSLSNILSKGKVKDDDTVNDFQSPTDTGESEDLTPSRLTITFGFGPSFFMKDGVDRYGVAKHKPKYLKDIPATNGEVLQEHLVGGDLCIQVCADSQQVAFHSIRNLIRAASGTALVHWMQQGFINVPDGGKTPRNLFGFKDGTANPSADDQKSLQEMVWAGDNEPEWMKAGTYMACRKIQMFLEMWDRTSLKAQEDTFGRKKSSGAAYGSVGEHDEVDTSQLPNVSHTRIAKETGQRILRRAYSYMDGMDQVTGNMDAGLMFICFQRNPDKQFVPMLKKLSQIDMMNEYIKHIGSAMFACPGGIKKGEYVAQRLFES